MQTSVCANFFLTLESAERPPQTFCCKHLQTTVVALLTFNHLRSPLNIPVARKPLVPSGVAQGLKLVEGTMTSEYSLATKKDLMSRLKRHLHLGESIYFFSAAGVRSSHICPLASLSMAHNLNHHPRPWVVGNAAIAASYSVCSTKI